jgi:hypothetical protein
VATKTTEKVARTTGSAEENTTRVGISDKRIENFVTKSSKWGNRNYGWLCE